jgi:hypothetical protein
VVLLSDEDSMREVVVPRLQAAGADLDRVHLVLKRADDGEGTSPAFPDDCDLLEQTIGETHARLVILDPFLAFLSTGVSNLNNQGVRKALVPLARLAERTRAALVLTRHLTKGGKGHRALYRGMGAMALFCAARTALLAARHPEDSVLRVVVCTKITLAVPPPALAYRVRRDAAGLPLIEWAGEVPLTADELVLAPPAPEPPEKLSEAVSFLQDVLGHGPATRDTVLRMSRAVNIADRTLDRAKAQLKMISEEKYEAGHNIWYWSLPPDHDSERIMRDLLGSS